METVSIRGSSFEIEQSAAVVTRYKVGDQVKVLVKKYSEQWESYPGVIISFDAFKNLPTIVIAYLVIEYSTCELKYAHFNAQSKDIEIAKITNAEHVALEKSRVLDMLDNQIEKKRLEFEEAKLKKEHFLKRFGEYFSEEGSSPAELTN